MRRLAVILAGVLLSGCVAAAVSPLPSGPTSSRTTSPSPMPTSTPSPSALARYPDGIPSLFDGQPVLRGRAVLAKGKSLTTAEPFLVGAWLDVYTGPHSCPIPSRSLPPDSWLDLCQSLLIKASDDAGAAPATLLAAFTAHPTVTFHFAVGLHSGPAILRVHVHDPRASQCGPDEATCDAMLVVETAVWSGDAAMEPRPISLEATRSAVLAAVPGFSLRLLDDGSMLSGPILTNARTLQQPLDIHPTSTWPPASQDGVITSVNILPSVEAMGRALPKVTPGVDGALEASAIFSGQSWSGPGGIGASYDERWLVVKNVAVSVLTIPKPSAADRALLVRLADALEAAAASPSS